MKKLLFAGLLLSGSLIGSEALKAQSIRTLVVTTPSPGTSGLTVHVFNDSSLRDFTNIMMEWQILVNGLPGQKGTAAYFSATAKRPALVRLPVKMPTGNDELFLKIRYSYRKGHPALVSPSRPAVSPVPLPAATLAEELLPLRAWNGRNLPVRPAGDLSYTDENGLFTVQSPVFHILFDKQTGWLQHYEYKGRQLLDDTLGLRTGFWITPAIAGYTGDRAAEGAPWQEAGKAPHLQLFSTSTGSQLIIVRAEYTLPETSCLLHLSYTINAAGEMLVEQSMESDSTQKGWPLPRYGMQWMAPPGLDSISWYGGQQGKPYLANTHLREPAAGTDVRWWKLTAPDGAGLLVTADSSFLTCTALPASTGTELHIDHPLPPYQLPYGNYRYAYKVSPLLPVQHVP